MLPFADHGDDGTLGGEDYLVGKAESLIAVCHFLNRTFSLIEIFCVPRMFAFGTDSPTGTTFVLDVAVAGHIDRVLVIDVIAGQCVECDTYCANLFRYHVASLLL